MHVLPDGTCLLFDERSDEGHTLNASGALVWDYCDGERTADEIAQELADLLPQEPQVRADTMRLLEEFAERGLLLSAADAGANTAAHTSPQKPARTSTRAKKNTKERH